MGFFGNASEVDFSVVEAEITPILFPGERVEKAYMYIRDFFVFTDKRLVLVDKQGFSGVKVEYRSIPYRNISHFAVESAGVLDLNAEMKIWLLGNPVPVLHKKFNKTLNIYELQSVLARYVLR